VPDQAGAHAHGDGRHDRRRQHHAADQVAPPAPPAGADAPRVGRGDAAGHRLGGWSYSRMRSQRIEARANASCTTSSASASPTTPCSSATSRP
jgi:hypothetical protein